MRALLITQHSAYPWEIAVAIAVVAMILATIGLATYLVTRK
jgi:hypothetical protein